MEWIEPPFDVACQGLPALGRDGVVRHPEQRYVFHVSRATEPWHRPDTFHVEIPFVLEEHGSHGISYPESESQGEWLTELLKHNREAQVLAPASMSRATLMRFLALILAVPGAKRTPGPLESL